MDISLKYVKKIRIKCNDYLVNESTAEDELPPEVLGLGSPRRYSLTRWKHLNS
nr:MAG TPA: hypothetical protein [Caudoviricetes sp.]